MIGTLLVKKKFRNQSLREITIILYFKILFTKGSFADYRNSVNEVHG